MGRIRTYRNKDLKIISPFPDYLEMSLKVDSKATKLPALKSLID